MSAAHTPGPWKYSPPDDQVVDLFTPEYFFIEGPGADVHGHMTLADARLIAAAPDLLAACQSLLRDMRAVDSAGTYGLELQVSMDQAYKAIAKATGSAA